MNINELDQYQLSDAVKFHDHLNTRLWDEREQLRPEVREKLMAVAADFQEFLGVADLDLQDITISGSNAAYNYTPDSDIDLHLVVKMPGDPVYQELFNAKKYQYNDEHDIRIGGADVELYVQPDDQPHVSQGIYSVLRNEWLQVPRRRRAEIDDVCVSHKFDDLQSRIQAAIASGEETRMQRLWDKIKNMRKTGLARQGEFGCDNLTFKLLRRSKDIERLQKAKTQAHDQALSLAERKPERVRYGFASRVREDDTGQAQGSSDGDAGAQSTWDGVAPDTQEFLNEAPEEKILHQFIKNTAQRLGIECMPRVNLHRTPDWSESNHSFGRYDPEDHELHVSIPGRHFLDVLRTTAHELAHCRQHEVSSLPNEAGETGSPWENQAHAIAGVIMRDFADANPQWFEQGGLTEDEDDVNSMKWPGEPIPFPKGTVKVKVSDTYDWYKLGQQISDLDDADPRQFGQGAPQTVLSFGSEPLEHEYIRDLQRLGMPTTDIDEGLEQIPQITRSAIAAACMAMGVQGCATVGDTLNTTRDVARLARQIEGMGRAGMQDELAQELKNYARARGGDANAQNQSILYRKERELREGGWDNPITQNTRIVPATVKAALDVMRNYVKDFNAWSQYPPIKLGHPTGSSAYYQVDEPDTEYGDIDLQIIVPDLEETRGLTQAARQGFWNRLWAQWIQERRPPYVYGESEPGHPILKLGARDWAQVDLMPHTPPQATWGRYRVTPERGTKGLLNGNMFSVLGSMLNMSIQHGGVEYKERDGVKQPYTTTRKNYELKRASMDIEQFLVDIFRHEYELITGRRADQARIDPLLTQNPGVDIANPNILRLARGIQGLARSFELNGLYGQGDLRPYKSAKDFVQQFLTQYNAKSQAAIQATKFDKAATADAQARAQRDKERIAQGTQRVNQMFDLREASGYIPTEAEKKDPRFIMALTQDVQPGETGRQANKLALKTDAQGRPALLRENEIIDEIRMSPTDLRKQAGDTGAMAGMEFEMYVPKIDVEDEVAFEPDYDQDRRARDIGDILDFFDDSDYNSPRDINRLATQMQDAYQTAWYEAMYDAWENQQEELIRDYLIDLMPEEEMVVEILRHEHGDEEAHEIMAAADEVERAQVSAVGQADEARRNPLYKQYLAAVKQAQEEYERMVGEAIDRQNNNYEEAFEQFQNDWTDFDEERWLRSEGIRSMLDVSNNFDIAWPYYTQRRDDDGLSSLASDFSDATGREVRTATGYHTGSRGPENYVIEPDGSLDEPRDYNDQGLEFISPPMPIDTMIDQLNRVVKWARQRGCYTNNTTGLHINVSVPGLDTRSLDYVKLALLLGDEYVLKQFGREANSYTTAAMEKIRDRIAQAHPDSLREYFDLMRRGLADRASNFIHSPQTKKYVSINIKGGYIEFRSPGGDWLHLFRDADAPGLSDEEKEQAKKDNVKIENTLLRFVVALDAAVDPQKYREEYLKKLYKILAPKGQSLGEQDPIAIFARYSAGELPQSALKGFIRGIQQTRQMKKAGATAAPVSPAATGKSAALAAAAAARAQGPMRTWRVTDYISGHSVDVQANSERQAFFFALDQVPSWHREYYYGNMQIGDLEVEPIASQTDVAAPRAWASTQSSEDRLWSVRHRATGTEVQARGPSTAAAVNDAVRQHPVWYERWMAGVLRYDDFDVTGISEPTTSTTGQDDYAINRSIMPEQPLWWVRRDGTNEEMRIRADSAEAAVDQAITDNRAWYQDYLRGQLTKDQLTVSEMPDLNIS